MDKYADCVDTNAALIGLDLAPEYRDGVVRYFALAASMAEWVMGLALTTDDEPAEVFVPIEPAPR